jgi:hypothetical protein
MINFNGTNLARALCALSFVFAVACSDDSDDGSGGAGGAAGAAGTAGTGGTGGMGGTGGSSGVPAEISMACETCLVTCDAMAAGNCDQGCWDLVACVAQNCADADRTVCAGTECTTEIMAPGAITTATALTSCVEGCATECADDLGVVPGDAGVEDAGN